MEIIYHLLILSFGVGILIKSADWFTDASVDVARKFRVPELIVGATIVSLATTLPEFAVSLTATVRGNVAMAVGNAVGSTICNVGLILGLCALISPMGVARSGFLKSGIGLLLIGAIFGALCYIFPEGSRWTGIVMIACLCIYIRSIVLSTLAQQEDEPKSSESQMLPLARIVLLFVVGAAGVILGSHLMVESAKNLAILFGVPEMIIALTLVAFGTSTPELVVSVTGIIKKHRSLAIGNIIGANILNLAWVIGTCSLVRRIPLQRQNLIFDVPVMFMLSVLLLIFGLTGQRLSRWEGAVFFSIYICYLIITVKVFGVPTV